MLKVLTLGEAAELLRIHKDTARRLARRGAIPAQKVGREWRFTEEDLRAFLERQPRQPETAP